MTVKEMKEILSQYDDDRQISVCVLTDYMEHWRKIQFDIKDISPVFDMDTNIGSPSINIVDQKEI